MQYTVQPGDSLWSIARRVCNDGLRWRDIVRSNPQIDPERLLVGQVLHIDSALVPAQPGMAAMGAVARLAALAGMAEAAVRAGMVAAADTAGMVEAAAMAGMAEAASRARSWRLEITWPSTRGMNSSRPCSFQR